VKEHVLDKKELDCMELQHITADIRLAKYLHKNKNQTALLKLKDSVPFFCGERISRSDVK